MIELIPNVSEGRRAGIVASLATTLAGVPGLHLLDVSSDWSHNRSVFTVVGPPPVLAQAAQALVEHAIRVIDLRFHEGEHPRIGAVDVLPLVPLAPGTMAECIQTARAIGSAIADRFDLPVFLYEEAAVRPGRRRLEDIRRGQFEGLTAKLGDPEWAPDFGPSRRHPTAGAVAVGARKPLAAFNVNLDCDRIDVAKQVAAAIRERSGGLPGVKALGLRLHHRGIVQVSMNLTDLEHTTLRQAFDRVREEAASLGARVLESEIVGLVPRAALRGTTPEGLKLAPASQDRVLEDRIASLPT